MAAPQNDFIFKGYGCVNTEMWTHRAAFEDANPDVNHFIKQDAPHYSSSKSRIAYFEWEKNAHPQVP